MNKLLAIPVMLIVAVAGALILFILAAAYVMGLGGTAVGAGTAGSAAIISSITTANGTPILDAPAGTILFYHPSTSTWSSSRPSSGYPGAAAITAELAFPTPSALAIIKQCGLPGGPWSKGQYSCGVTGYRGECAFWAEMNWAGPAKTVISGDGAQVAGSAISLTNLTGATSGSAPQVGDILSWPPGGAYSLANGHAAVIVGVNPTNHTYVVDEMNYDDVDWNNDVRVVSDYAPEVPVLAVPPPGSITSPTPSPTP